MAFATGVSVDCHGLTERFQVKHQISSTKIDVPLTRFSTGGDASYFLLRITNAGKVEAT